ncbi:hypothetical protein ILYODFUR_009636 [Ilyodon furcidens]|uniref:Uncharacterized protein n=1 Tax=Ilyodon furcidens TaxID=33524 RepID=A0ABV0U414_9TELE
MNVRLGSNFFSSYVTACALSTFVNMLLGILCDRATPSTNVAEGKFKKCDVHVYFAPFTVMPRNSTQCKNNPPKLTEQSINQRSCQEPHGNSRGAVEIHSSGKLVCQKDISHGLQTIGKKGTVVKTKP